MSEPKILLDPREVSGCPVKVQNRFDASIAEYIEQYQVNADAHFETGFSYHEQFRDEMFAQLTQANPGKYVDLRLPKSTSRHLQISAAISAMDSGAELIISPLLPDDEAGHRKGRVDLLVRGADRPDGSPGYYPVVVTKSRILATCPPHLAGSQAQSSVGDKAQINYADFSQPTFDPELFFTGWRFRPTKEAAIFRVAHAWEQLVAAGRNAGGKPIGGLISIDKPVGAPYGTVIYWCSLTERVLEGISSQSESGWRAFSPMSRYRHESNFRVKVAKKALAGGAKKMVHPIVVNECDGCIWWQICRTQMGEDDLSLKIEKAPLDAREITVLWDFGITSVSDLARVDIEQLLPKYLPRVMHRPGAEKRIRLAKRRCDMIGRGVLLERTTTGKIDLPSHGLEIDIDIETSIEDRVYLWGFTVTDLENQQPPYYKPFVAFKSLTDSTEVALAKKAMKWLTDLVKGRDAAIYHYSDYELVHIRKLAKLAGSDPVMKRAVSVMESSGWDLFKTVQQNFFGVYGLGLKSVARIATGFDWHDPDASGLNSQYWFNDATHHPDVKVRQEMREKLLTYNEDDTLGTKVLREWMRTLS